MIERDALELLRCPKLTLPKTFSDTTSRPMQRRIDPDDIADPYGGVGGGSGNRVSPMMTPSGRAGLGGRF